MNVKLGLKDVVLLIDKRFPLDQISAQLQPIAKQANLVFPEFEAGAGYLQWSLPGADWISYPKGTETQKTEVAQAFQARIAQMQGALQGSPLKDVILSFPSEDFIYFRPNGENWDIAVTGWGYKYPDKPATKELDTFRNLNDLQDVNVAFAWAERPLPSLNFKLAGLTRTTSEDGFFHFDQPLPVGKSYSLETLTGQSFTLLVEKGKKDYVFDLTQYVQSEIAVYQNNMPYAACPVDVSFNGVSQSLTTDAAGHITIQLPLQNDILGQAANPQPAFVVTCNGETQQQIPENRSCVLNFAFNFQMETPPPPPLEPTDRKVQVKIEVFRGDAPVVGQACDLTFGDTKQPLTTDENGEAFYDLVVKGTEKEGDAQELSPCEVACEEQHQSKTVEDQTDYLVFRFDLPVEEKEPEPEFVYIQLKDYGGEPMPDLPFILTTKKKQRVQLQTDKDGLCKVPKEWFTPKEKMKIEFVVSPEYQQTHDLHDKKKK